MESIASNIDTNPLLSLIKLNIRSHDISVDFLKIINRLLVKYWKIINRL